MRKIIVILMFLFSLPAHAIQPPPNCASDGSHAEVYNATLNNWSCVSVSGGGGGVSLGTSAIAPSPASSFDISTGLESTGSKLVGITIGSTEQATFSVSGLKLSSTATASTPALFVNSTPFTGGTATTTKPMVTIGTGSDGNYSTLGGMLGINAPSGFSGPLFTTQLNGGAVGVSISTAGGITILGTMTVGAAQNMMWSGREMLSSPIAGTLQMGSADAASPVAQTLRAQNVSSGNTNTAGQNLSVDGSASTGSAIGGNINFNTSPAGTTGSTQNAEVIQMALNGAGGVAIGSTYASITPPISGLIIVGSTSIGTSAPVAGNAFTVSGSTNISGAITDAGLTTSGTIGGSLCATSSGLFIYNSAANCFAQSAAAAGTLTGTTLASNVVSSSLTSVGTISTGVWSGTPLLAAEIPADVAYLDVNQSWTKGQAVTPTAGGTQTAGGTYTPDFSLSNSVTLTFGAGNLTIANPTNVKAGQTYQIALTQDATGGRSVIWGTNFKWTGGIAPVLSTPAGAKDVISCWADTTSTLECGFALAAAAPASGPALCVTGSPIAAAATIAPTSCVQHVTGTAATIANITLISGMSATVGGSISLIADAGWSWTNTGNISNTGTASSGVNYTATYDGSKWYIK